jgi:N6-adenosine-specific RNA methylase IME4
MGERFDGTARSFGEFACMRPHGGYGAIYADPPWRFFNYSPKGEKKNPVAHYDCLTLDDLQTIPVDRLAARHCALFMWATFPMLPQALSVMAAWGFAFKSGGAWAKRSSTGGKWHFGPGYVFRSAAELFLVGTRGAPRVRNHAVRNLIVTDCPLEELIVAPVREHSRKPDAAYEMIEALYDGPYVELFSRASRAGWSAWGNEVGKFDGAMS